MKTNNKGRGCGEPSILDYFSKSKRKERGQTPTTPYRQTDAVCGINESNTPASVVSDDSIKAEPSSGPNTAKGNRPMSSKNTLHGTPMSSGSTTPDTHEPPHGTPPSPGDSCGPSEREKSAIQTALSAKTPPSNDTRITTPSSPPTPKSWRDCPVYQKENDSNCTKFHSAEGSASKIRKDLDATTPMSLLETNNDAPADNDSHQRQSQSVNLGTPSTSCTPSTTTSSVAPKSNAASISSQKSSRKIGQGSSFFSKPKKQKQSNQLFLDFGQRSFGKRSICNICGMLLVHGLDEDDAQHAKVCKEYKEGVTCLGWNNERSVASFGKDDRILEVRPEDAQHRNKVVEVKAIVDRELGFANNTNEEDSSAKMMTSYMYISKKRVVGLLVVKRIQRAYELLPSKADGNNDNNNANSSSISRSLKPSKALLGIHQVWVHKAHRHRGIASKLVTAARDHLIFGMSVPLELVAFSSPTEEGLRFAKGYTGSERPLIYDIH